METNARGNTNRSKACEKNLQCINRLLTSPEVIPRACYGVPYSAWAGETSKKKDFFTNKVFIQHFVITRY